MTTEPRLFWEHGTLLQPQHFQLLEMSRATDCALLASLSSPYPWGVRELQIDEDALALGIVSLKALDVIFPDLTHAVLGQNALIAPQNCAEFWPNREEALMVCLGLPALSHASPNVTELAHLEGEELARASTRFVASLDPEQRPDLLAGGAPADVRFMLLNLKLVFRQEGSERAPGGDLALLPLARLHSNAGTIVLDKGYVPPCVDIRASKILQEYVKGVRNTLASRLQQFEDYKLSARETSGRSGRLPLTIQSLALHTMLQVLARHLPLFEHVCETGFGHPWTIYAMMRLANSPSLAQTSMSLESPGTGQIAFQPTITWIRQTPWAGQRPLCPNLRPTLPQARPTFFPSNARLTSGRSFCQNTPARTTTSGCRCAVRTSPSLQALLPAACALQVRIR